MSDTDDRTFSGELGQLLDRGDARSSRRRRAEITLHQLRIFWAVAHSETLTRAAKHLGLAQPSLSQQLAKLEATAGTRLFRRHATEMTLTEAGTFLLPKAEQILRNMQDLEDGLAQYSGGQRVTIRLAGINSVLRVVLPGAINAVQAKFPDADFDIQESAPGDILEMLYSRRVNIGLLAANSVAEAGVGFLQVPVIEDPYVLVVPERLDLDGIADAADLPADAAAILNRSIQFIFGTQHAKRVADWYDHMLPEHRVVAQCRSFEVALGLVRAGSGICLAPALSTLSGGTSLDGVRLYRINAEARRIVALVASQYRRQEPYESLINALQAAGASLALPAIRPTPPFLDRPSLSDF
ncbi:LysR family transcriptional regulator [Devosia sp.]|uniref:LysR family transcriptional regulator n=1 Tax=Devosia sp. TaxID=1871048 RepID=UPI001AD4D348|nr:LysR family transcriptional regulator [Devosia sp.]MBN9308556.1 LysR family transcriptional regulator [Devosia sp.]